MYYPERVFVTPAKAALIVHNEALESGHFDPKVARFLHGGDWGRWCLNGQAPVARELFEFQLVQSLITKLINQALQQLPNQQEQVISTRFGVSSGFLRKKPEVAELLNLTMYQTNFLEKKGLLRLKEIITGDQVSLLRDILIVRR